MTRTRPCRSPRSQAAKNAYPACRAWLFPQAKLVVRQKIAENLIVEVKGTRLAIDASMARRILMEECPNDSE
ncbi:hypothetical protein [Allobaculum sp. Allo2]|uniref:hypothetical protein n=1 Tax=Allobaculum sp. Allo2 TaxID=2853432 RepID=UPI001F625F24|nr:hypothetical protein [Allobaculum sp. Allo2]UNT93308.1 hypothetical protein KWG61_00055 [Allobaculum sp. Allo2]